jgi:CelD/BcsL family acetyltransferase involved in cellulose biosynthesis
MRAEEITSLDDLEALRGDWTTLCDRSPRATPFQRPEWLIPWWRAFRPGEPWVLAVRQEGRLAALAPLLIYPNEGKKIVAFCGGGISDYCDVVTDPDGEEEAVAALLDFLAARRERWDVGDFEPVPAGSPLLRMAPDGLEARTEPRDVCPGLDLPDRVEDLREVVSTRQLANLRKYRRKAEALGELRLQTVDDRPWEQLLDVAIALHGARWNDLDGGLRAFHREAAAGFHARGCLGLYALCLDGKPLAALYGFREKETFYCYMQGFDPEWAKLSPGAMVVGGVIEDAVRRGARRIDFLRGREAYKYAWGATDRETFRRTLR